MKIYTPQSFESGQVGFVPTTSVSKLDISPLEEIGKALIDIEDDKLATIESNYNAIQDTQDALFGITGGTTHNNGVLQKVQQEIGLNTDTFKMSPEDLKDPFKHRQIKSKLNQYLGHPDVQEAIRENEEIKKFEQNIKRLEKTNPIAAFAAKQDLAKVRSSFRDPNTGAMASVYNLNPEDYTPIDFGKILATELKALPEDTIMTPNNTGDGYTIFSEKANYRETSEQFSERMANKYADDPRVYNTFRTQIDRNKPPGERGINDPDAVREFLKEEFRRGYELANGRTVSNAVRENRVPAASTRSTSTVAGKTTTPQFTSSEYGKVAEIGNELIQKGYEVPASDLTILRQAFDKDRFVSAVPNDDGSITYNYTDVNEDPQSITFKKAPVPKGFTYDKGTLDYLNTNPVLSRSSASTKNFVAKVMENPVVRGRDNVSEAPFQDMFFREEMYPKYVEQKNTLEADPAFREKAQEKGITGNKLFYLLHHNGSTQSVRDYVMKGTASIKGNSGSDSEIQQAFQRAEATFGDGWDDVPTEDFIKTLESNNNPQALYQGDANSSAFGAYQFTISNWEDSLKDFAEEKGIKFTPGYQNESGFVPGAASVESKPFDDLFGETSTPAQTTSTTDVPVDGGAETTTETIAPEMQSTTGDMQPQGTTTETPQRNYDIDSIRQSIQSNADKIKQVQGQTTTFKSDEAAKEKELKKLEKEQEKLNRDLTLKTGARINESLKEEEDFIKNQVQDSKEKAYISKVGTIKEEGVKNLYKFIADKVKPRSTFVLPVKRDGQALKVEVDNTGENFKVFTGINTTETMSLEQLLDYVGTLELDPKMYSGEKFREIFNALPPKEKTRMSRELGL